jgi:hypothetical protein
VAALDETTGLKLGPGTVVASSDKQAVATITGVAGSALRTCRRATVPDISFPLVRKAAKGLTRRTVGALPYREKVTES